MPSSTREEWLQQLVGLLRPHFKEYVGQEIPEKVHVSCGWPSRKAMARKRRFVGQCFPRRMSRGEFNEIFVSPVKSDPVEVAAIIVHELIHAVDDCVNGHKGKFIELAAKAGLVRPWTQTSPNEALVGVLKEMIEKLGAYPHSALDKTAFEDEKKPGSRLIKVVCPDADCGVVIRMTRKYIEEDKIPTCACGQKMQEAA
jgi:hypothetical protein